jgi:hypothetical protein
MSHSKHILKAFISTSSKEKKNVYILPVVKCIPDPIDRPPSIEINPAVFSRYSILAHRFS